MGHTDTRHQGRPVSLLSSTLSPRTSFTTRTVRAETQSTQRNLGTLAIRRRFTESGSSQCCARDVETGRTDLPLRWGEGGVRGKETFLRSNGLGKPNRLQKTQNRSMAKSRFTSRSTLHTLRLRGKTLWPRRVGEKWMAKYKVPFRPRRNRRQRTIPDHQFSIILIPQFLESNGSLSPLRPSRLCVRLIRGHAEPHAREGSQFVSAWFWGGSIANRSPLSELSNGETA
jgi:hypothetical protein